MPPATGSAGSAVPAVSPAASVEAVSVDAVSEPQAVTAIIVNAVTANAINFFIPVLLKNKYRRLQINAAVLYYIRIIQIQNYQIYLL